VRQDLQDTIKSPFSYDSDTDVIGQFSAKSPGQSRFIVCHQSPGLGSSGTISKKEKKRIAEQQTKQKTLADVSSKVSGYTGT
jgi:hypothetical protein